jgi:hypothetical protein
MNKVFSVLCDPDESRAAPLNGFLNLKIGKIKEDTI